MVAEPPTIDWAISRTRGQIDSANDHIKIAERYSNHEAFLHFAGMAQGLSAALAYLEFIEDQRAEAGE